MAHHPAQAAPEGLQYLSDVLSAAEEQDLAERIGTLAFSDIHMHGVVAKRRVAHFGWLYGYDTWRITPGPPIPEFLLPFRSRIADLVHVEPAAFVEALVTEYPPGAGIGWHRDAPMFGPLVVGMSLLGTCRLRFQRGTGSTRETFALTLEPRSVYVLGGPARFQWQHSIPPMRARRYSITFRTVVAGRKERVTANAPYGSHGALARRADGEALRRQSDAPPASSAYHPPER